MLNPQLLDAIHDWLVGQKQQLGFLHDQNFDTAQNHNLGLGHTLETDMSFGQNDPKKGLASGDSRVPDHDQDLTHGNDEEMAIVPIHGNNNASNSVYNYDCDHENGTDEEAEVKVDIGKIKEYEGGDVDPGDHDHQLHLFLADGNDGLELEGNRDFDRNLILHVDNNRGMGLVIAPELDTQESELFLYPPVIQCRTLAPTPDHELRIGQEFSDVKSCRRALRDTAIALHFEMQTIKSDQNRFTAKCASDGCPWRIHAAKLPGVPTFTIRTLNDNHTCGGIHHLGHQQASVQWVANSIEQRLRENPYYKPKDILEEIHCVHGITLSYKQAWRGKERIMAAVRGSLEEGYRLLPQYCHQIHCTNPGSIARVYGNPVDNSFQRLFVSFQASIYGFLNGCRPLLGLDRMVLKSECRGTLLIATAFDGDGALFPLAFGVVDEENEDHWMWFLSEIHNLLEINTENMPRLTILSDTHEGIAKGVEANFPSAFHGICMHHLAEHFQKGFNNTVLVNLLWEAANALVPPDFDAKIQEIEELSADAAHWIRAFHPRLWATAYFEGMRFGHLTANVSNLLNPWILEASGLPIIQMMESIRRQLMAWFNERCEISIRWTSTLVPTAEKKVLQAIDQAEGYQVFRANDAEFQVVSHEGTHNVDVRTRRCHCQGWQKYGLPCSHAVAALASCRQNVYRFTESCFTVASYRKAYSQTIHPIPDKTMWENTLLDKGNEAAMDVVINPPTSIWLPANPRKRRQRAKDHSRVKRVVNCSRCKQSGHFRTTCTAPL